VFAHTSRYYALETAALVAEGGRVLAYKRRRFLPPGDQLPLLALVLVTEGDRLDLIATRTLGDPEQFWRVADANDALDPFELTATPGRTLRVPVPQP
jgi:hypothetical protein